MVITDLAQFELLVQEVRDQILSESQGVGEVDIVGNLDNIYSLPALKLNDNVDQVVEVPLSLLSVPAEEAAATANAAAQAANTAAESANNAAQKADEATTQVLSGESERVEAENARQAAETERQSVEEERKSAEEARKLAEQSREEAEASRVSAEESRVTAESERVTAESNRVQAETERVLKESERESAELTRQLNETTRQSNEDTRVQLEQTRLTNEEQRVSAESSRETEYTDLKLRADALIDNNKTAIENANTAAENANAAIANMENTYARKDEIPEEFILPIATADLLGGVKIGTGLSINSKTGVLNVTGDVVSGYVDWDNITNIPDFKAVATSGSYTDLIDTPVIPSKISELKNDSNYLTTIPEEYITETELNNKNYATISQIPSLDGYATEAWISEQGFLTEHQDISNLATKEEIPKNLSLLTNDSGYLTSIPSEYITDTELSDKNYATIVQLENKLDISVANSTFATKEELSSKLDNLISGTNIKTINGETILGTGDITIENYTGSVDITDIILRITELIDTGGTCTEEDYNTLKNCADNGIVAYINTNGRALQTDVIYTDSTILICFKMFDGQVDAVQQFKITSDKVVTGIYNSFLAASVTGQGILGPYTKPSAYSAITKSDSISKAIGKLEANVEKITVSGDGTKFLANNGQYLTAGGAVNISEIVNRLYPLSGTGTPCADEDYNTLKEYADNGTVTYVNSEGTSLIINIKNITGTIILSYSVESENGITYDVITVSSSKVVTLTQKNILPDTKIGSGLLGAYTKPASYSAISKEDSISTAIGKLEAGLGTSGGGSSSDDIYYLPTAVFTLDTQATKEEIEEAFGGLDKKTELINAIKAGKKIYIQGDETYPSVPVAVCNFFNIQAYITFIRIKTIISVEIVKIAFANYSTIEVINPRGYKVDGRVNLLTSSSTTDEISTALEGISGIKKLKKAIEDGNSIYTTFYNDSSTEITSARLNLSVVITSDDSNYVITICGVQGEGLLKVLNAGYLRIEYNVASDTFTCERYNNAGTS